MQNLLLVGGDRRALYLSELLAKDGYAVETLGLRAGDGQKVHMEQADAALFPYPFSVKGGSVPCLTDERIRPEEVLSQLKAGIPVIAGRGLEGYVEQDSFCLKRYTDAELLEKRNAELSAEAAVCEAMLHSRLALMDARVLVTGYGLFGRALALRLKMLGAKVWIAARREGQRALAADDGMNAVSIREVDAVLSQMDLVLNTVPAQILTEYHLKLLKQDCWLLELASAPYGFDMDAAKALGVSCALLPGLPARYAPLSAAMALRDAVTELLGRAEA